MTATMPPRAPDGADAALAQLERFTTTLLPSAVRRLSHWKGVPACQWHDLLEDVLQELALDCLQHGREISALPQRQRNGRWMRLLERNLYRLRLREQRRIDVHAAPDRVADVAGRAPDWTVLGDLDDGDRVLAKSLAERATHRNNGRLHLAASARSLGVHSRQLRQLWERVAEDLGYGPEFLAFWRRRLAEALVGLAADLLRDAGAVRIHGDRRRRRPDPRERLRRIRRIRTTLSLRPIPRDLRSVLARVDGSCLRLEAVWQLLRAAADLAPHDPAIHMWCFEAAVVQGDARRAARSLRDAAVFGAAAVPLVLARARLLEVRGREPAAARMLSRALERHRGDPRLAQALRGLRRVRSVPDTDKGTDAATATGP